MMRKYRYVILHLIITMFISLCNVGCYGRLKKWLGCDSNSNYDVSDTKKGNEIKFENPSKTGKKEDKEEDPLIEKRKEYFENTKVIKKQYTLCDKIQDLTKYKIDNDEILKDVIKEVNKVNEEDRIFIQSDTEGKVFNIISALQIANIIYINNPITVYYNFYNGNFEKNKSENSIELKLFEVNKNFKGTIFI